MYLGRHHLKESQAPPPGWSGRRLRAAKGWWERGAAETRASAKLAVRDARLLALLRAALFEELDERGMAEPLPEDLLDDLLAARLEAAKARRVEVVRIEEGPSAALRDALRVRTKERRAGWRTEASGATRAAKKER
jgi:hypothetical protein